MIVDASHWQGTLRSLVITVGPDTKKTPPRDRDFHYERTKGGIGAPRMPRKNCVYSHTKRGGMRLSSTHRVFRRIISMQCFPLETCFLPVRLRIDQTYGAKRTIGDIVVAGMDSDACLAAVRDALQTPTPKDRSFAKMNPGRGVHPRYQGVIADDALIVQDICNNEYVPNRWELRITVTVCPHVG